MIKSDPYGNCILRYLFLMFLIRLDQFLDTNYHLFLRGQLILILTVLTEWRWHFNRRCLVQIQRPSSFGRWSARLEWSWSSAWPGGSWSCLVSGPTLLPSQNFQIFSSFEHRMVYQLYIPFLNLTFSRTISTSFSHFHFLILFSRRH